MNHIHQIVYSEYKLDLIDEFCLIIWTINIIVFTPRDEHSQGEHPHIWLHQRDCTYKSMIKYLLKHLK